MKKGRELTKQIIEESKKIIAESNTVLTIRSIHYQLFSKHIIPNTITAYKNVDRILVKARKEGVVDDSKIVDSSKPSTFWQTYLDLSYFKAKVPSLYHKDYWWEQPNRVEVWCEKDTLSGLLLPICARYQVPLVVGRGYQSLTHKKNAEIRFENSTQDYIVLYLGDFDASGLDISRDLEEHLGYACEYKRIGLTLEQVTKNKLSPVLTKKSDSKAAGFVAKYGHNAAELDALPPKKLEELVITEIEKCINRRLWDKDKSKKEESIEIERLEELLSQQDWTVAK